MDTIIPFLISHGYVGMTMSSFLAGSILPFSSEVVMLGLLSAGLSPVKLLLYGTVGNTAGSMFNYFIGRMGRIDWVERYLHIKRERVEAMQKRLSGHGAWIGFFAFVPVIGSVIAVTMGLMRANITITTISMATGKILRYAVLIAVTLPML